MANIGTGYSIEVHRATREDMQADHHAPDFVLVKTPTGPVSFTSPQELWDALFGEDRIMAPALEPDEPVRFETVESAMARGVRPRSVDKANKIKNLAAALGLDI